MILYFLLISTSNSFVKKIEKKLFLQLHKMDYIFFISALKLASCYNQLKTPACVFLYQSFTFVSKV